ncbi:MAG: sigma-54-dependent transcriptional regulator [Gemmatimonadota bacterium]
MASSTETGTLEPGAAAALGEPGRPAPGASVLVCDDEPAIVESLSAILLDEGYQVETAGDGEEAWQKLRRGATAILLVDLMLPGRDGLSLLASLREARIPTEAIIITGQGSVTTALQAMRDGAYDYLTKPVDIRRLLSILPKAAERYGILRTNQELKRRIDRMSRFEDLIGESGEMKEIYRLVEAVADTDATVFIQGESGTGKELVARAIHNRSSRHGREFVPINCGALPRDIIENELFGHVKGAFTGSIAEKAGSLELSQGGTVFLDEIAELEPDLQVKILRVLEDRQFRRLGGRENINLDVRFLAATNQDVRQAMEEKTFREDLYYRLSVVEIHLPPLRNRFGDILLLAEEFLRQFAEKYEKRVRGFDPKVTKALQEYGWPGNVRELKNVIERAVVLTTSERIGVGDLPARVGGPASSGSMLALPIGDTMENYERRIIYRTLEHTDNNKTQAAKILGVSLKTLHNKLNRYEKEGYARL